MRGVLRLLPFWGPTVWIGGVLLGMSQLWSYESTPTHAAPAVVQWPTSGSLRPSSHVTLVMAAHPCCPCTRASVSELARIMARSRNAVAAYVLCYTPKILPKEWHETDLYTRLAAIPGVTVVRDEDGREAARFHATVSGQTLLFDAAGHLRYSGGITSARGVEGDSVGQRAVLALIHGEQIQRSRYPAFGCSLFSAPLSGQSRSPSQDGAKVVRSLLTRQVEAVPQK